MTDNKTEQLSLRMSSRVKALLQAAAALEHRSASNMVEHLVLDYCVKNGIADDGQSNQKQQPVSKDSRNEDR